MQPHRERLHGLPGSWRALGFPIWGLEIVDPRRFGIFDIGRSFVSLFWRRLGVLACFCKSFLRCIRASCFDYLISFLLFWKWRSDFSLSCFILFTTIIVDLLYIYSVFPFFSFFVFYTFPTLSPFPRPPSLLPPILLPLLMASCKEREAWGKPRTSIWRGFLSPDSGNVQNKDEGIVAVEWDSRSFQELGHGLGSSTGRWRRWEEVRVGWGVSKE